MSTLDVIPAPSPAAALLAPEAPLVRSRPLVVLGAFLARLRLLPAVAAGRDVDAPVVALDLSDSSGAAWVRAAFESGARGSSVDPGTWQAMRARALLVGGRPPALLAATELALERPLRRPRFALLSPGGSV